MKKVAILLAAVMAAMAAWGGSQMVGDLRWEYEISGESAIATRVSTTNGTKVAGAITIPSYLGGRPVTAFSLKKAVGLARGCARGQLRGAAAKAFLAFRKGFELLSGVWRQRGQT